MKLDEEGMIKWSKAFIVIGLLTIIGFIFAPPFNDWSWQFDPSLFSNYGEFIGGFVGALFSLAGFILLYLTLRAQQSAIGKQQEEIDAQKRVAEKESFETTFFNLLTIQQGITNDIIVHFNFLAGITDIRRYSVKGREFFRFAAAEMFRINDCLSSQDYLGIYDEEEAENWEKYINDLWQDPFQNHSDPNHVEHKEQEVIKNMRLKLTNKLYNISEEKWRKGNITEGENRIKYIYRLFFERFDYATGHYFRNLYHIMKYVEQFEQSQIQEYGDNDKVSAMCNQYAQFIQAQMSSYELAVLHNNAIYFSKARTLIEKYNLSEHMPEKYLINNHRFIRTLSDN